MLVASHYLTYPHTGPVIGGLIGPNTEGYRLLVVSKETQPDNKVRVGLYMIDTEEAADAAGEFLGEITRN